jgi:predicted sulfurtransferase
MSNLPYNTMFKLDERGQAGAALSKDRRHVVCVNCQAPVSLGLFLSSQDTMESMCPSCKMTAEDYWSHKPHRKVTHAEAETEE